MVVDLVILIAPIILKDALSKAKRPLGEGAVALVKDGGGRRDATEERRERRRSGGRGAG